MENTNNRNENNNTVDFGYTNMFGQEFTHDMVVDHIDSLAHAIKNRMWVNGGGIDAVFVKRMFNELLEARANYEDNAIKLRLMKLFWSHFNNHEQAVIKNTTKTADGDPRNCKRDSYAINANELLSPVSEQMRRMRNTLSAKLKKGQFELFYSRREYNEAYSRLTVEEFTTLYRGSCVKVEDLVRYLGKKLDAEYKAAAKKVDNEKKAAKK